MEKSKEISKFSEIFNIVQGDVVSFTGGGGKTSLIFYLAEELSQKGSVLITTTTKMYIPNKKLKNVDFLGSSLDLENEKLIGVDDKVLKEFIGKYDYILIEADGSAGKSLKYWNDFDPVISEYTDKILGITNLEAVGKTVEEGVHRYEKFCERYVVQKEQKIDCELMIRYINSGEFFKTLNIKKIQKYIFINGVEGLEKFNSALKISKKIDFENIYLGSIREREIYPYKKISAIALLSGFSKRMGEDKLFLEYRGKPLVNYLLDSLESIDFHKKILVIAEKRVDKFKNEKRFIRDEFTKIINSTPEKGQGYSIKLGIESDKDGYMFFMGDQPLLIADTILKLMKEFMKSGEITLPTVGEEQFSPVIFPNRYRDKLCKIKGDRGGKSIIQPSDTIKKVIFQDATEFMDIDTPKEMEELKNRRK